MTVEQAMKTSHNGKWFAVLNGENRVLAVYGSALEDLATAKAKEIFEQAGSFACVQLKTFFGDRPYVGQILDNVGEET